jgi:serine/threonine-protein kinase RsbW
VLDYDASTTTNNLWEIKMAEGRGTITEVSIPSNPDYLARLRRIIGCLADCAGMDSKEIHDAKLAITEACANAIRHGSPQGQQDKVTIKISAALGTVVTEVTDHGSGFEHKEAGHKSEVNTSGLGIPLMKALTDEVEFLQDVKGMTVRLVKRAKMPSRRRWIRR